MENIIWAIYGSDTLTSEGPQNVNGSDEVGENEKHEIKTLLCEYSDVLTDSPRPTSD